MAGRIPSGMMRVASLAVVAALCGHMAGTLGAAVVQVGAGSDLAATQLDSSGSRLNVDNLVYPFVDATTYNVVRFEYSASTNVGNVQPFLAVLTGVNTYEVVWVGPTETSPAAGGVATSSYTLGTEQFSLDSVANLYAGVNSSSNTIYFGAGVTDHDNPADFSITVGSTIGSFGASNLARSYAFEINVEAVPEVDLTLTWDGAGDGTWTDDRWTGLPTETYPTAGLYAIVQNDTVTITGDQSARRLTVGSGGVSIGAGASLTLSSVEAIAVAPGAGITMDGGTTGASLIATGGGGSIRSLTVNGLATISNALPLSIDALSDGGAPATFVKQGAGNLVLTGASPGTITSGATFEVQGGALVAVYNAGNNPIGNASITLNGGGLGLSSTGTVTFDNAITVAESGTIAAGMAGSGTSSQTITLGSATRGITVDNGQVLTLQTGDSYNLILGGSIDGAGAVSVSGSSGMVQFNSANSYQGQTIVSGSSRLLVRNSGALGTTDAGTVVGSGAQLRLENNVTLAAAETITIAGNGPNNEGALRNQSGNNTVQNLVLSDAARITSNSGTLSLSGGLVADYAVTFDGSGTTDVSGVLGGGSTVTKYGSGLLMLSNAGNTFSGQLNINAGRVRVSADGQLGDVAGGTVVASNATLEFNGGMHYTTLEPISIVGVGYGSFGAINSVSGNNRLDSNITINGDATINSAVAGSTLTLAGQLLMPGNSTVSFTGAGNIDVLQGFGPGASGLNNSVITHGSGTVTFSGANSYNGATAVNGGTLVAGHSDALGTADAGTTINNGTLALQGGISIPAGESLALGGLGGAGTLQNRSGVNTFAGAVSLGHVGATFESQAGALIVGGGVAMGDSSLTVAGAGNTEIAGAISGTSSGTTVRYEPGLLAGYITRYAAYRMLRTRAMTALH